MWLPHYSPTDIRALVSYCHIPLECKTQISLAFTSSECLYPGLSSNFWFIYESCNQTSKKHRSKKTTSKLTYINSYLLIINQSSKAFSVWDENQRHCRRKIELIIKNEVRKQALGMKMDRKINRLTSPLSSQKNPNQNKM